MTLNNVLFLLCASFAAAAPLDNSTLIKRQGQVGSSPSTADLDKRNKILIAHGIFGFLAFQVVAPIAVVIASVGRSSPIWFKLHSRLQLFVVFPSTVCTVTLGVIAATYDQNLALDKHKILGFVLIGVIFLQLLVGWWAHWAQKQKERQSQGIDDVPFKRRFSNWIHIVVGISLLTFGGLQVTWGFDEWRGLVGTIPTWIVIVHWTIAGVPVLIVTPFVLVRGLLRMRRGQSFAQAFFARPETPRSYVPPRKLFLGSSSYIDEAASAKIDDDKGGDEGDSLVGHAYDRGNGFEGRQKVEEESMGWPGAATREEYETSLELARSRSSLNESIDHQSISNYDYNPTSYRKEEKSSLLTSAAPMGSLSPSLTQTPSQDHSTRSVSTSTYPLPKSTFVPFIPPDDPIFPSTSISPIAITDFSPALHTPSPPPLLSPRLSFMPFGSKDAVNHRSRADTTTSSFSISNSTDRSTSSTVPPLLTSQDGEGEQRVVVVPTPPLPPPTTERRKLTDQASTLSSVNEAFCNGDLEGDGEDSPSESPGVSRHLSMAGEIGRIEVARRVEAGTSLASTEEESKNRHNKNDSESEEEEGGDDAESTRLMDELERELSISASSTRTGRSRYTATLVDGDGDAAEGERREEGEVDEQTRLAREQSGKWLSG